MILSNRVGLTSAIGLIKSHRQKASLRSYFLQQWHRRPVNGLPVIAHLIGRTAKHCGACRSVRSTTSKPLAMLYREELVAACKAAKLAAELCTVR